MIFFKSNKNKIILFLVTIALVVIMALSGNGRQRAPIVADTFGVLLSPFQAVGTYISDCLSYGADRGKFENENNILKQQLVTAKKNEADYERLAIENDKLRSMLELQRSSKEYKLVACDVVSNDSSNWSHTLRISKGIKDGIKKNDTVITESGLVGYISDVGRTWAQVTTIIDTSSSVSSVLERIEEYCMIQGDVSLYDKNMCAMKYAATDSAISVGDILVTSGDGGVYPEGLNIGKVSEIKVNTNGISQDAVIEPFVDFENLTAVLVIVG